MAQNLGDKQLVDLIDKAIKNFARNTDALGSAIGYLMIGRKFGWRAHTLTPRPVAESGHPRTSASDP